MVWFAHKSVLVFIFIFYSPINFKKKARIFRKIASLDKPHINRPLPSPPPLPSLFLHPYVAPHNDPLPFPSPCASIPISSQKIVSNVL